MFYFSDILSLLTYERLFELDYFMPLSLYWNLLKAYFKDDIIIYNEYKHLDLIEEDGLLEQTNSLNHGKRVEGNMTIIGRSYAGKYVLTTKGKKAFLKTTQGVGFAVCTVIGVVIGWLLTLMF